MNEREPAPLPDDVLSLLEAERRRAPPADEQADRILQRVAATVDKPARPGLRSTVRPWRLAWAPLVAAAAAVLVFVSVREPGAPDLPSYDVELVTRDVSMRSGTPPPASDSVMRQSGSDFELDLRPEVAVAEPLEARAFTVREGAEQPWRGALEVSTTGAVRLRGTVTDVFDPPHGRWTVVVAIGRSGTREPSPALLLRGADRGEGWRFFRRELELP